MTPALSVSEMEELRAIDARLPAGPWEVWSSNSFRRITGPDGKDGGVLSAYVQRSDGHPDLSMTEQQLADLCALRNALPRLLASSRSPEGGEVEPKPLPLDLAPRDGTMLRLLVDYSEEANREAADALSMQGFLWPWTPLEDAFQAWTVGFNNLDNTGEDEWQFAGWNWSQDCFTEGHGKIIGWLPFHGEALATRSPVLPSEEDVARVLRPFIEAAANSAIPEPWEVVSGITSQATRAILALLPPGGRDAE